ncbi:MAG TPA: alkaline phosphatase family protein [Thermoanaerobaculaceae bacterium]|nr:alkaline phosphatase family protein [Thermoanaerobaculaceae bacterium]
MIHLAYIDPGSLYTVSSGLAAIIAGIVSALTVVLLYFRRLGGFLKRRWRIVVPAVVVVGAGVALLLAGGNGKDGTRMASNSPKKRLFIVALDGMSPEIVEPMMAAGKLPNFARLKQTGSYSRLGTTNPAESPVAWTTFATGRNPGKHGVYDFIRRNPSSYLPDLSLTRIEGNRSLPVRRTKAFWQYGREAGVPMEILACPVTFPPDEINGKMLSGMGAPDLLGTQGTFSFYTTEPETVTGDTGGEVHVVAPANPLDLELLGPQKQGLTGRIDRLRAAFSVKISDDRTFVTIKLQDREFVVGVGEWSEWEDVTFRAGPMSRMHGILRFNLVSLEPYFKLYASPICIDPRKPWFPISYPADFARELAHDLGLFSTRGMPFDTWALNEARLSEDAFITHATDLYEERVRLMEHELARFENGVFYVYFEYPDIIQHMYWRVRDPGSPTYEKNFPPRVAAMIDDCYEKMDAVVGLALAQLRAGDTLIVLSDHGFTDFRRVAHVDSWLRDHGYLVLRDGADEGEPLFANVDWSRTRAYALGFGGIYVNLRGREPQGIVEPGPDQEALRREIADGIRGWTDPKDGAAVLHAVYLNEQIFKGPEAAHAPDVYLGFSKGYGASWQTALGAAPRGPLVEDNLKKWSGTHLVDPPLVPGILFVNRPITKADPTLYDLAPTILRFIGLSDARLAAEDLDGKPLF